MKYQNASDSSRRHPGPSLMLLALSYTVLVLGGIVGAVLLSPRAAFPMPYQPVEKAIAYVAAYSMGIRVGSFFQLASAIPLGVFVATVVSRLRFLGVRAAGELIALCGGVAAMVMLIVSALADWSLSTWTASTFIPIGRFMGIVWMIGIAATLPKALASGERKAAR